MRRTVAALIALLLPAVAAAQPSPTFTTLHVNGAASLLGGGTHTGTFTGGTFSGITLGGSITGTGATITGGTFSGITLSGTIAGNHTYSGAITMSSALTLSTNNQPINFRDTNAANTQLKMNSSNRLVFSLSDGAGGTTEAMRFQAATTTPSILAEVPFEVTGTTFASAAGTITLSGSTATGSFFASAPNNGGSPLWVSESLTGTTSADGMDFMRVQVVSDNLVTGGGHTGNNVFAIKSTTTGGNATRTTLFISAQQTGQMACVIAACGLLGIHGNVTADHPFTNPAADGGNIRVSDMVVEAQSGATGVVNLSGYETDIGWMNGATPGSSSVKFGYSYNMEDGDFYQATGADQRGALDEGAFRIKSAPNSVTGTNPGVAHALQIGGVSSQWPINTTNGTIIGYLQQGTRNGSGDKIKWNAGYAALDLVGTEWSQAVLQSGGLRLLDGGDIHTGPLSIAQTATGTAIDVTRKIGSLSGIAAGGINNKAGEHLYGAQGEVINIDSVNGSGTATAASYVSGHVPYATSPPSNPVTLWGGSGLGNVTINESWASPTLLQIGASANTLIGTGSALATNATNGFLLIPSMAGTPTGNVGALGQVALVWDSTNKKLCTIAGATVECSAAFTP